MNVVFFEAQQRDRDFLKQQKYLLEEATLNKNNVQNFSSATVISVFVHSEVTKEVLAALPHLKLIATRSTGFDHIDMVAARERGVTVVHVPTYGEHTVAEHTFALLLALTRKVPASVHRSREGNFATDGLLGMDLCGKTLGVLGAGKIGQHVVHIGRAFGMQVQAYDPHCTALSDEDVLPLVDLKTLLETSDVLSLHVPYTPETHHLLGEEQFQQIKKGALLINTARGPVVETKSLLRALENGTLAGAGLDVVEGENSLLQGMAKGDSEGAVLQQLLDREDVLFTPHLAYYSKEALERIMQTTLHNIEAYFSGTPVNVVR